MKEMDDSDDDEKSSEDTNCFRILSPAGKVEDFLAILKRDERILALEAVI